LDLRVQNSERKRELFSQITKLFQSKANIHTAKLLKGRD
jgi:hypothetical protein